MKAAVGCLCALAAAFCFGQAVASEVSIKRHYSKRYQVKLFTIKLAREFFVSCCL